MIISILFGDNLADSCTIGWLIGLDKGNFVGITPPQAADAGGCGLTSDFDPIST